MKKKKKMKIKTKNTVSPFVFIAIVITSNTKKKKCIVQKVIIRLSIGSLSKDVFERRTSTGSESFSLFICLDANKFVLLSFFSLIKTIYLRVSTKPLPNDAKNSLPVDVRRSKTLLLKLPNERETRE